MVKVNLDKVQEFMNGNKHTEQAMAEVMGISHSYFFRVIRGERKPGRKFIEGLIQAGMSPVDIFFHYALPKGNASTELPTGTDGH